MLIEILRWTAESTARIAISLRLGHAPQPSNGAAVPQAAGQSATQDYSAEWANYYRTLGKIEEAEAIEKQIAAAKVSNSYFNLISYLQDASF